MASGKQRASTPFQQGIAREELYNHIGINIEDDLEAFETAASPGKRLETPAAIETTKWLSSNNQFKAWFESAYSQLLLVKWRVPMEPVTTFSYFSTTLLLNIRKIKPCFPLYFFCGMSDSGASSGPHVLLRSLIAQILICPSCDTSHLTPHAVRQIASFESTPLLDLFATLVKSLHNIIVVCVIDGFSLYHSKPEVSFVLHGLQRLVGECTGDVVLKVLLTDPVSRESMDYISQQDTLMLPHVS
ncbi:hypothetical protein MMC27_005692 [Xylographa pallens]|nr:hypothetical protein [Xylographa pallens]